MVVVSYDVCERLRSCLERLLASEGVDLDVIVVDNASADGSPEMVRREFPTVTVIANRENRGFGAASNQGIQQSGAPLVLSLNPDTEVSPTAVGELARFLNADPQVGAVSPKILRPDGSLDLAARRSFPSPSVAFFRLTRLSRLFPRDRRMGRYNLGYRSPDEVQEIDAGTGACLLFRRAALAEVGLFDERFFMYGEDLDLCYRLKAAGWRILYDPRAVIVHYKGQSSRQRSYRMIREFHRSMAIFYRKHYQSSTPVLVSAVILAAIEVRSAVLLALNALRREKWVSK